MAQLAKNGIRLVREAAPPMRVKVTRRKSSKC